MSYSNERGTSELVEGRENSSMERELIISLITGQDENGFWGLIKSPKVDRDARVQYWYMPTYIAATFMMVKPLFYLNKANYLL